MLFGHEMTKQPAAKPEESAKADLQSGNSDALVADIKSYIDHVALHLVKENHRLFMMADIILQGKAQQVSKDLSVTYSQDLATSQQRIVMVEYFLTKSFSIVASREETNETTALGLDIKLRKRF